MHMRVFSIQTSVPSREIRVAGVRPLGTRRAWVVVVASVALVTLLASGSAPAFGCILDSDCDDGFACTGMETCDLAGQCQPGIPVDCTSFGDQCNDGVCQEPSGTCTTTPKIDGFGCNDNDRCTLNDRCEGGLCVGGSGGDADNDGYCDLDEMIAGCNAADAAEIPSQPNVYSGGQGASRGEVLMTFNAPTFRTIVPATDPSCTATAGVCDPISNFCTAGRVADPCAADSDCNLPPDTCRLVVNYADTPDLVLVFASLKLRKVPLIDIAASFLPATPGCSRKVDLALTPGFRIARVRLKVTGTTDGKVRSDRDRIIYKEPRR